MGIDAVAGNHDIYSNWREFAKIQRYNEAMDRLTALAKKLYPPGSVLRIQDGNDGFPILMGVDPPVANTE